MLALLADGRTDTGLVRNANEDCFCAEEALGLFAVADGMGGHAAGNIASAMAVDILRDHIGNNAPHATAEKYDGNFSPAANRLAAGVRHANRVIHEAAQKNEAWRNMGTTLSAVLGGGERLGIAHVGDSRVYLIRHNAIIQLTEDHSVVGEQVRQGLMSREEAERSASRNVITRALGVAPEVEVDLADLAVYDGDRVVLCSDGLYTMVPDEHILAAASARDPAAASKRLLEAALEGGGKDNVAVVVVCVLKSRFDVFVRKFMRWARR